MSLEQKRVYFVGLLFPRWPGFSGGEIREYHLLRALLGWGKVWGSWLFAWPDSKPPWEKALQHVRIALPPPVRDWRRLWWWHLSRGLGKAWAQRWPLLFPWPLEIAYYAARWRATLLHQVVRDLTHLEPDILMVSPQVNPFPFLLPRTDMQSPRRWVLSTFDVEAERLARLATVYRGLPRLLMYWEARRARVYEQTLVRTVDGIIAVSPRDREAFITQYGVPANRVWVAPNGVDVDYFAFQPPPPSKPPIVLFVGTLAYPSNHAAALRLVQRIMPRVRQELPQAQLWLVGRSPKQDLLKALGSQDRVFANVPDVRPYYHQAQVVCIPLEAGSGTKLKVLEALSIGRLVVATPTALEGLFLQPDEHLFVAETDEDLAAHIVKVLRTPQRWERMRQQARFWVERRYAWNVTLAGLNEWLEALLRLPRRASY